MRSAPFTLTKFESLEFNTKKERRSSETPQKDARKVLEVRSNRTNQPQAYKPLVALQLVVEAAKGSDKLLDRHGYQHLFECVSRHVRAAPIADVAETLCTCLQQRVGDEKMLSLMATEFEKRDIEDLPDKYLGLIVHGLAVQHMNTSFPSLVDKCALEVKRRLCENTFNHPSSLAMMCWALTITNQWSADFAEVVRTYIMNRTAQINSALLPMLLWSLSIGNWKCSDHEVLRAVLRNIVVSNLRPMDHCQILQALERTLFGDEQYFNALARYVTAGKGECLENPKFVSTVIRTCSAVLYYHSDMMDCLADAAVKQLSSFNVISLIYVAHNFSTLSHIRRDLLLAIVKEVCSRRHFAVNLKGWVTLIWSCLVAEVYPPELFQIRTWEEGRYSVSKKNES